MDYCRVITHVVQPGDTYYKLAQRYQTTVPDIIMRNPGINPYNLLVGSKLTICSGRTEEMNHNEMDLNNDMRKAWLMHVFWILMYETSFLNDLSGLSAIADRLELTPEDIAEVFSYYYPQNVVNQLSRLLSRHTELTAELMEAMKEGNSERMEQLEVQNSQNSAEISRLLSSTNGNYNYDELLRMMNMHTDTTKRQIQAGLDRNQEEEIRLFDENANHVSQMADYMTDGLIKQFYPG